MSNALTLINVTRVENIRVESWHFRGAILRPVSYNSNQFHYTEDVCSYSECMVD